MPGSVFTSYFIPKPDNNSLRRGELEARIILYFSKFSNITFLYFITTRRPFHEPSIFLEPSRPVPPRHGHIHIPRYDEKYKQLFPLSQVPHQQLGLISTPEPRQLLIQVYDRGAVDSIEKAIHLAELGLNPSKEGSYLRVSIPALTEERRKELIKKLHKMGEETKIALRNNRRDQLEVLKGQQKSKAISEDDLRRAQEEVQKITDKFVVEVDQIVGAKEKELLEV